MCDCYNHKCDHPGCHRLLDTHLGDFSTKREEVEIFCGSHIPADKTDGTLWEHREKRSHHKVFIRALTKNAVKHADINHPNEYHVKLLLWFGNKPRKEDVR